MKKVMWSLTLLILSLVLTSASARGQESILSAIPADALGFVAIHNLDATSQSINDVAQLVQAPPPNLLAMGKVMTGMVQGVNDQGDAALVLVGTAAAPKHVALVPVSNFAEFFTALNATEPAAGSVVEVQMAGSPTAAGRIGNYAALAPAADRETLEAYIAATTNLADSASLAEWTSANRVSAALTSRGIKELLPKVTEGIRSVQTQMGAAAGAQGVAALDMYLKLFAAAEVEVEQFGLGLRIAPGESVSIVKRVQFVPGGSWAAAVADVQPAEANLLAGLRGGSFAIAMGTVLPTGSMDRLMKFSLQMMQSQPEFQLTPELTQKYLDLTSRSMQGVKSMGLVMGAGEPGAGFYGDMSMVMQVEDTSTYLDSYEATLASMRELADEAKSPMIPKTASQRVKFGDGEALELTMDMSAFAQAASARAATPGAPDMTEMMKSFWGPEGKLKMYFAPADEHAVVIAYTSPEKLQQAIDFYRSKQPGLADEAGVATVSKALPAGSHFVMYFSINGLMQMVRTTLAAAPGRPNVPIPELRESPPLAFAAKITPQGIEGGMAIAADTLRAIGEAVAKARAGAPPVDTPQP